MKSSNTSVCIYLPVPLAEKINQAAKRDDRSRSAFIRRALERAVADSPASPTSQHQDTRRYG